eukprot:10976491-Heterocapsa_arctica.AAC.1
MITQHLRKRAKQTQSARQGRRRTAPRRAAPRRAAPTKGGATPETVSTVGTNGLTGSSRS